MAIRDEVAEGAGEAGALPLSGRPAKDNRAALRAAAPVERRGSPLAPPTIRDAQAEQEAPLPSTSPEALETNRQIKIRARACALSLAAAALLIAASARADERPVYWRAAFGGEFNEDSHAVLDLGVSTGGLTLQLQTDTLDARWSPSWGWGKGWVGARGEAAFAGILFAPWERGALVKEEGLLASYAGLDAGMLVYLPEGFYAGASADGRLYDFGPLPETTAPIPAARGVFSPTGTLGWWRRDAQAEVRLGADLQSSGSAPRIAGRLRIAPEWTLGPLIEIQAGAARGQDFLTLTRLGGLNPYVVPMAGAAWAEFRVQSFATARLGPRVVGESGHLAVVTDLAAFDGQSAFGIAALGRYTWGARFVEASAGFAPALRRQSGLPALSVWLLGGVDWSAW